MKNKELEVFTKMGIIKNLKVIFISFYLLFFIFILILASLATISILWPPVYSFFNGDKITQEVMSQIGYNITDPNELALRIHKWEHQNFYSPYPQNEKIKKLPFGERLLAIFGFWRNKEGKIRVFRSFSLVGQGSVPPQWVLYSKLANCGEYAKTFVYLMNKYDIKARIVQAPGEDHTWAEYYVGKYKIIFDPSNPENPIIVNPQVFGKMKNFSYVEAYELNNPEKREDVSDEYIKRGTLIVRVFRNGKPVSGAQIEIKSTYLMMKHPNIYNTPKLVTSNTTNENGVAGFKLGEKEYVITSRKCALFLCWIGEENSEVRVGSITVVDIEMKLDYDMTIISVIWIITSIGIIIWHHQKGYLDSEKNIMR